MRIGSLLLRIGAIFFSAATLCAIPCRGHAREARQTVHAVTVASPKSADSIMLGRITEFGFHVFAQDCAKTVGSPGLTRKALTADGFVAQNDTISENWVRVDGRKSKKTVWLYGRPTVGLEAFTQPDGQLCRVHIETADTDLLRREMIMLSIQANLGGLAVHKLYDGYSHGNDVSPFVLAYALRREPPAPGEKELVMVLETSPKSKPMASLRAYIQTAPSAAR